MSTASPNPNPKSNPEQSWEASSSIATATAATTSSSSSASSSVAPPLVMQIIVDGSSPSLSNWPKGPWMAQAAHAAIAVIVKSSDSPNTRAYVSERNLDSMHKVVLQTPSSGKAKMDLHDLARKLDEARRVYEEEAGDGKEGEGEEFPQHCLWIEQPENVATCLAIAPNRKPAALKKVLRACTLLKD